MPDHQDLNSEWLKNTQKFDELIKKRPLVQMKPTASSARANVEKTIEKLKKKGNEEAVKEIKELDSKLGKFIAKASSFTSNDGVPLKVETSPTSVALQQKIHGLGGMGAGKKISVEVPARLITTTANKEFTESIRIQAPMSAVESKGVMNWDKELPLQNTWCFHYDRRGFGSKGASYGQDYENNLFLLGTTSTVQTFWRYFNHIKLPFQLELNANVHVFKEGIKPMWEDPANAKGGKWTISFSPGSSEVNDAWIRIVCAIVGETIDKGDDVCGAVFSRRAKADRISVWIRSVESPETVLDVGVQMLKSSALKSPYQISMEFQLHSESLITGSSYNAKGQKAFTFDEVKARLLAQ